MVKVCLYKGVVFIVVCEFEFLFYFEVYVIFEDDVGVYDQKDVVGFIQFNVLCLKFLVVWNNWIK